MANNPPTRRAARQQTQSSGPRIASDVVGHIYSDADVVVQESQVLFVLHKDTIKTFLHEKLSVVAAESRFLAYIGIELTLVGALISSDFKDTLFMSAALIKGLFLAFSFIVGAAGIINFVRFRKNARCCTPDKLTEELGKRGSIIVPPSRGTTIQ
jgi:hypothetical protein